VISVIGVRKRLTAHQTWLYVATRLR